MEEEEEENNNDIAKTVPKNHVLVIPNGTLDSKEKFSGLLEMSISSDWIFMDMEDEDENTRMWREWYKGILPKLNCSHFAYAVRCDVYLRWLLEDAHHVNKEEENEEELILI